jgi:deoxyribodipyrimidine photo-lyase
MITQILWFKRDLRLSDHAAFVAAASAGPVLPLFVVEPEYWALPDVSERHWRFWSACVEDVAEAIAARGGQLIVRVGEMIPVLQALHEEIGDFALHSHQETGNAWTFERDKSVKSWCRSKGVIWHQHRQFGVLRGSCVNRDRWSAQWDRMMAQPLLVEPVVREWVKAVSGPVPSLRAKRGNPDFSAAGLPRSARNDIQEAGRDAAEATLWSFLNERGEHYTREMSSPITGETACSRLSPHLAYGTLSMREVTQAAQARYVELPPHEKAWRQAIRSFIARLHWHCHFIQKLESEPEAEWQPFARAYDGLRPQPGDPGRLAAWSDGQTGFPFIDAAMRYLNATGWINFRMRAMLMSFASYDLWLPWQESGMLLARKFTDYEPGIHWPQCQMQAGETGINTVRIYSPVKQGHDQDPDGRFIRRWVPELAALSDAYLHEPWRMDADERAKLAPHYPPPLVDHAVAAKAAKDAIYALRRLPENRAEAKAVVAKHGSRKRHRDRIAAGKKADAPQLSFDLGA